MQNFFTALLQEDTLRYWLGIKGVMPADTLLLEPATIMGADASDAGERMLVPTASEELADTCEESGSRFNFRWQVTPLNTLVSAKSKKINNCHLPRINNGLPAYRWCISKCLCFYVIGPMAPQGRRWIFTCTCGVSAKGWWRCSTGNAGRHLSCN